MPMLRWGAVSLVVLAILGLDLMGSTPTYKSGLHEDRLLRITLDEEKCKGAAFCEQVCPVDVFDIDHDRCLAVLARTRPMRAVRGVHRSMLLRRALLPAPGRRRVVAGYDPEIQAESAGEARGPGERERRRRRGAPLAASADPIRSAVSARASGVSARPPRRRRASCRGEAFAANSRRIRTGASAGVPARGRARFPGILGKTARPRRSGTRGRPR